MSHFSIVTRTGDTGTTGLYGPVRVSKDSPRIHACGTVDELNAILGIVLTQEGLPHGIQQYISSLQHVLFRLGADLATPLEQTTKEDRIAAAHITDLELHIVTLEALLPAQTRFLLPGGTAAAAHLHHARTVCRSAERLVVTLHHEEPINTHAMVFLNRLSDYLFLAARKVNQELGKGDVEVKYTNE